MSILVFFFNDASSIDTNVIVSLPILLLQLLLYRYISAWTEEVQRGVDTIGGQTNELLRIVTVLTMKLDEMMKSLHEPDVQDCY